ncbi:Propanediol utilization protein [Pseudomonas sp. IT-P100]|uniref:LexA family transcriptional regulator n=1 Tax=Pseudomonas sp. IT-P100 TaxID=3026452 RepID=UPI0039DFB0E5
MVHIEDIRAAFVTRLKKALSAHGIDQWGAGARLAEIAKVTPKASSKWLNGESLPGPAKMSAIADALGVKIEWLQHGAGNEPSFSKHADVEPAAGETASNSAADIVRQMLSKQGKGLSAEARSRLLAAAEEPSNVITVDFSRPGQVGDEVWIAHYDVRAAMGGGQIPHEYPEMLQDIRVSPKHLREMGVTFKEHFHLKMITGWGQSMAPTIKDRDPLLVDITIREFTGDGIYLFSHDEMLYVKRLQKKGKERFKMISDNKHHDPEDIRVDDTHILARVLYVWNGQPV